MKTRLDLATAQALCAVVAGYVGHHAGCSFEFNQSPEPADFTAAAPCFTSDPDVLAAAAVVSSQVDALLDEIFGLGE